MKIKKVQISGFRAFSEVKDSTFNFVLPDDSTADFISVYAPNGFGKTSFYDAVEWGVTHQIRRFDRMIDFNKIRKENGSSLLLNNVSKKGEVIVETSDGNFKNNIQTRKVYNPKGVVENGYFKEVILSQDLIDTFIKEEKAEERYNKFVEFNPQIRTYNNSLKNLTILFDFVESKMKELNSKIDDERANQIELDFEEGGKKFDEINKALKFLQSKKEEVELIYKETFNQVKYDFLDQKIKSRLISLDLEIQQIKTKIESIDLAYKGQSDLSGNIGVFSYLTNRDKVFDLEKTKNDFNDLSKEIKNKENCESKDKNFKNQIDEELKLNKLYSLYKEKFKKYLKVQNQIDEKNKLIVSYERDKLNSQNKIKELNETNQKNSTELNILKNQLTVKQINLINIPSKIEKLSELNKSKEALILKINELNESISKKIKLAENFKLNQLQNHFFNDKIDSDIEILIDENKFSDYRETISVIVNNETAINDSKYELLKIVEKINLQNELDNELKDFVSKGLEIISKNNTSTCPLCDHTYQTFSELSERITGNKLLGKVLKESLEAKLKLENRINKLISDNLKNKDIVKKFLKKLIDDSENERIANDNEVLRLSELKEESIQELINSENKIKEINNFFENTEDFENFKEKLNKEIVDLENLIIKINQAIVDVVKLINDQYLIIEAIDVNIKNESKNITDLKLIIEYTEVINFFKNILKTNEVNIISLDELIEKSEDNLAKFKKDIEDNLETLEGLNLKLLSNSLKIEEVLVKINETESAVNLIKDITQNYEQIIKTEFKIDLVDKNKNDIDEVFEKIKNNEKEKLELLLRITENYIISDKLRLDCLKVTQADKIQKDIEYFNNEFSKLKIIKENLKTEKDNLISYLKRTIDGFFYKELINKIYSKIDPHPDYSEIEFECDFEEKNPRLQIYTIKYENGIREKSVPALYFSTAQINILSLSIFLARALKAKNPKTGKSVDCIFIDDPIQSMDSINILSFIDLFRTIIMFLGKQLIVSTHEYNFHLLLKKKIPKALFSSKYIEFETFGKLKPE